MLKNNQKYPQDPVLGASRSAPYTHAEFSKDLQVYHLLNKHHPNKIYDGISNNFVQSIELKDNPSEDYSNKMKNIYMDQLDSSLNEYKKKVFKMNTQSQQVRRDYKENVNSMILSMEKQDARRHQALRNSFIRQQYNKSKFVDANMIKNNKIDQFVSNNELSKKFQAVKTKLQQKFGKMAEQNNDQHQNQRRAIYNSTDRTTANNFLTASPQNQNIQRRQLNNLNIGQHIPRKFSCQYSQMANQSKNGLKILRVHNPITNPIQYHIDNPYFINKMQKKYTGSQYN